MCVIPRGGPRPARHISHALNGQGPLGSRRKNKADVCMHNLTERTQLWPLILGTAHYYIILISQYFNFCMYQFLYI